MNSEKIDYLGWALPIGAVAIAIYAALSSGSNTAFLFAGAILLLTLVERRRAKIVTTSLIKITDENGEIRGLIGWDGQGIQIGVRTDSVYNAAVAYQTLWSKHQSIAFSFKYSSSMNSLGEHIECRPSIGVMGEMTRQWRSYAVEFSFTKDRPSLWISQVRQDGVLCHSIPLS